MEKILVIGAARSGLAASKFLAQKGKTVILTDTKGLSDHNELQELAKLNIETLWGMQPKIAEMKPDLIVMSPGVPLTIPPVVEANQLGIPVIGELELAYQYCKAPFIAITGTNGKTTTTSLIGELLKTTDKNVVVGGNIGFPLITQVEQLTSSDLVVAEVSSFQLETAFTFKPRVAIMLNLTPDHLDRHGNIANYLACKARIFQKQQEEDFLILNYDDEMLRKLANQTSGQVLFFSQKQSLPEGVYLDQEQIVINIGEGPVEICHRDEVGIRGAHNLENVMAAVAAAYIMGMEPEVIARVLQEFKGVEHRLEPVRKVNGVQFINDSKGTNPDSTIKALEAFSQPIVLIAGGKDKGSSFEALVPLIQDRVKAVVVLGETKQIIMDTLEKVGYQQVHPVDTFEDGVAKAAELAQNGDVVLLSPACASWDMFNSFEERGDLFKQLVAELG